MKRVKIALLLLIISLLAVNVLAQSETSNSSQVSNASNNQIKNSLEDAKAKLALKTDPLIEKEIKLPSQTRIFTNLIFGVKETVALSFLIIFVAIWLLTLMFLSNILQLLPSFKGVTALYVSLGLTVAMAFAGIFRFASISLLQIDSIFTFLEGWKGGVLAVSLLIIILITLILSKIFKSIREKAEITQAHKDGAKIGAELGFMMRMREMFGMTNG
jgi:hypothetical protein